VEYGSHQTIRKEDIMNGKDQFSFKKLIVPGIVMLAFWILAIVGWQSSGYVQPLILFGYIGTSLGVGLGLYATLPKKKKQTGRKVTNLQIDTIVGTTRTSSGLRCFIVKACPTARHFSEFECQAGDFTLAHTLYRNRHTPATQGHPLDLSEENLAHDISNAARL
jgi:hypothetical protein